MEDTARHYKNASGIELSESETNRQDSAPTPEASAITTQAQRQQRGKMLDAIECLAGRQAVVVWLDYIEGQTLETLAPKLGIVSSRVSQLHRKAIAVMNERMGARG
jgi:RNA polymerase sigma factor (sigma-70 family)